MHQCVGCDLPPGVSLVSKWWLEYQGADYSNVLLTCAALCFLTAPTLAKGEQLCLWHMCQHILVRVLP